MGEEFAEVSNLVSIGGRGKGEGSMGNITIPLAAVPLWILAVCNGMASGGFFIYRRSHWAPIARTFSRTTFVGMLFWTVSAGLLGAHNAMSAAWWDRMYLPTAFLAILGLIEAGLLTLGVWRVWHQVIRILWIVGIAFLVGSLWPGVQALYRMRRVPDGYWIGHIDPPWELTAAHAVVYGGGVAVLVAILAWAIFFRRLPRMRWYGFAVILSVPFVFNDSVWVQHHMTPYPTLWVVGFAVLGILWGELSREVRGTHRKLNVDTVTGAGTRLFGDAYGWQALHKGEVALVYGDVDRFKSINDTYGHSVGDQVLHEVVARLRGVCRDPDQVVRAGGDEFMVIMPGARSSDREGLIPRFIQALEHEPIRIHNGDREFRLPISVSLGWAHGLSGSPFDQLVAEADRDMYRRKHQTKRTRVAMFDDTSI